MLCRHETCIDSKIPRCIETESVTGINFVNSGDEHESIVGWGFYPNSKAMSENNDNKVELLSPSPAWRHPTPRWGEGKVSKDIHENNYSLAVCTAVVTVGWAYLPNSVTKNISIIEAMQGFSPP